MDALASTCPRRQLLLGPHSLHCRGVAEPNDAILAAPPSTLGAARRRRLESGSSPTTSRHRVPRPARAPPVAVSKSQRGARLASVSPRASARRNVPVPDPTMVWPSRNAARSAGLTMPEIGRAHTARSSAPRRENSLQQVTCRLRRTAWRQRRCMGKGGVGRRRHSGRNCGGEVRGPSGAPGAAIGGHLGRQWTERARGPVNG